MLEKEDYITLASLFRQCSNTYHAGVFANSMAKELLAKAGIMEPPKWYETKLPDDVRKRIQEALYDFEPQDDVEMKGSVMRCKFCRVPNGHGRDCATMGLADTVPGPDEFIQKVQQMLQEKEHAGNSHGGAS